MRVGVGIHIGLHLLIIILPNTFVVLRCWTTSRRIIKQQAANGCVLKSTHHHVFSIIVPLRLIVFQNSHSKTHPAIITNGYLDN